MNTQDMQDEVIDGELVVTHQEPEADEATQGKQEKPIKLMTNVFDGAEKQLRQILPAHVTPERFRQSVLTAVASNYQLLPVMQTPQGRQSIFLAAMKCAGHGLVPDGTEAAIVPFKGKASYLPMVRGIVTRMQQSPECKAVGVNVVHQNDEFEYAETESGTVFHHKPLMFQDRGAMIGVYAFFRTHSGGFYFAALDMDELLAVERTSKANDSPWKGPFKSEMQKKTALKRLAKIAPVSRDVQQLIEHDNAEFHTLEDDQDKPKLIDRLDKANTPALEHDDKAKTPAKVIDAKPIEAAKTEGAPSREVDKRASAKDDKKPAPSTTKADERPKPPVEPDAREDAEVVVKSEKAKPAQSDERQELQAIDAPPRQPVATAKGAVVWAESFKAYWSTLTRQQRIDERDKWDKAFAQVERFSPVKGVDIVNAAINSPAADEDV